MDSPAPLVDWLAAGDLRSDGLAPEVARLVIDHPVMLSDLVDALANGSDIVRGHAADAVERVSREIPADLGDDLDRLIAQALDDPVPMVRWHLAMLLGNLRLSRENAGHVVQALIVLLEDRSPFVKSWAISSLCQVVRAHPVHLAASMSAIGPLQQDASIAVRHRAATALRLLADPELPFPASWVKRR